MRKIVLMGNPNVGKSVIFSRLTGTEVIASNYPGTTVDFSKGKMRLEGETVEVIDAPGTYSLQSSNRAEEVTSEILKQADIVINVIDATNLERNLFLTLELLERKKPLVVALNMWDEAKHLGIEIDVQALKQHLEIPVIPTCALTGEGIKELVESLKKATLPQRKAISEEEKWVEMGFITKMVQKVTHRHHTMKERISDATIKPMTGIPVSLGVLLVTFCIVRFIGENLKGYISEPLFELCRPVAMNINHWLGEGFLREILIGKLIDGKIDYIQSMGILTTGLFVPFGMVLPYIIAFYFMLAVLEDSGYLPRLATLTDNVFHKLGMHGHSIVCVFLGLGCNVPGALATRTLETRKQRFISVTLMAIAVPCAAKTAMVFGILGPYGISYILLVFATLLLTYILVGLILNRYVEGESSEIFLEIPPYRIPSIMMVSKKTWMRMKWFLKEAIPFLFLGVLLVNILYALGILEWVGVLFAPLMEGFLGLPKEATVALLIGFLRKDLAVGMLLSLGMNPEQLVIAVTTLTMYFPCVATFTVLARELGFKDMIKATIIMITTAFLVGVAMRLVLIGI